MDHAEALELLEIAAVEPGGLDRLMAGDTPEAAAVAGHLAGCESCALQVGQIRRTTELAREVIRTQPDPALRERTLAYVRAVGRPRDAGDSHAASRSPGSMPVAPLPAPSRSGSRRLVGWAAIAAAVLIVVSAGAGYLAGTRPGGNAPQDRDQQIALLADAATTAVVIQSQPDAQRVALVGTAAAPGAAGSILFSAAAGRLVATATALPALDDGEEYGCWAEVAGQRIRLGRMYPAGKVWTWAGSAQGLDALPAGSTFGVSVGPIDGRTDPMPVLTGTL